MIGSQGNAADLFEAEEGFAASKMAFYKVRGELYTLFRVLKGITKHLTCTGTHLKGELELVEVHVRGRAIAVQGKVLRIVCDCVRVTKYRINEVNKT